MPGGAGAHATGQIGRWVMQGGPGAVAVPEAIRRHLIPRPERS
jgi:hypothetical protein